MMWVESDGLYGLWVVGWVGVCVRFTVKVRVRDRV
jgi:hypothetical protein